MGTSNSRCLDLPSALLSVCLSSECVQIAPEQIRRWVPPPLAWGLAGFFLLMPAEIGTHAPG